MISFNRIINGFKRIQNFNMQTFKTGVESYLKDLHTNILRRMRNDETSKEESVALEVFKYRNAKGDFTKSTRVRLPRPGNVKFRVGQVVQHKKQGYYGVIVGWDEYCRAPKNWIDTMHPGRSKDELNQPNYLVLIHTKSKDRSLQHTTYVIEENLQLHKEPMEIENPGLSDYFDFYDGFQYHMRPAMKILYPED